MRNSIKPCFKKSRGKGSQNSTIFYLNEDDEANIAKKQLLGESSLDTHARDRDRNTSRSCQAVFESWSGERLTYLNVSLETVGKDLQQGKIKNNCNAITTKKSLRQTSSKRYYLKSDQKVDMVKKDHIIEFRSKSPTLHKIEPRWDIPDTKRSSSTMTPSLRLSMTDINKRFKNTKTKRKNLSLTDLTFYSRKGSTERKLPYNIKQIINNQLGNSVLQTSSIAIPTKNISDKVAKINSMGCTLRKARQNKGNWVGCADTNCSKIIRVYQIQQNRPISNELNKLISLLQEQNSLSYPDK